MPSTASPDPVAERTVTICLTDPMAIDHRTATAHWFCSELPRHELEHAATGSDPTAAVTELVRRFRSASATVVTVENGHPRLLVSAKGAVGSHERFLAPTGSGWYVSDHFRNAISQVPVADRRPTPAAMAEHYIFRAIHADLTYAHTIERVSNGEVVAIDLTDGTASRELVDKLTPPVDRLDRAEAIARLDEALAAGCRLDGIEGRTAVLFSGGIDSTVLLTYLHPEATPVTFVPDTPEFAEETVYARSAAALLEADIHEVPVQESDFLQLLAETTETMGWPAMHSGTPMFTVAYDEPFDTFFLGEGADALLGVGMRLAKVGGWLANPVTVSMLNAARNKGPAQLRHRINQLHDAASRLSMPVGPRSFALGNSGSSSADDIGAALGTDLVVAALQKRLDFVDARVEIESPPDEQKRRNIEYRHWVYALGDPLIIERHQAQARGKALVNPFGSAAVVEAALAVPPDIRYSRGLRGKWMPKEVLKKRLPAYPIDQIKKPTAMPFERLYATGPLSNIWDSYDVPAEFTGRERDDMVRGNSLTWQAISYAVWDAHVGTNTTLTPHPGKIDITV